MCQTGRDYRCLLQIIFDNTNMAELRTETVTSNHVDSQNERRGTVWTYYKRGPTAYACRPAAKLSLSSSDANEEHAVRRDH